MNVSSQREMLYDIANSDLAKILHSWPYLTLIKVNVRNGCYVFSGSIPGTNHYSIIQNNSSSIRLYKKKPLDSVEAKG